MTFSLNEVEVTAKKATRGAGYSWGLAEEAGKASRWLCSKNLNGCEALASLLELSDGDDLTTRQPITVNDIWQSQSNELCPLLAGTALSDHAFMLRHSSISMASVVQPILLLPFAAAAARQLQSTVTVIWDGVSATTNGTDLCLDTNDEALNAGRAERVEIRIGGKSGPFVPSKSRAVTGAAVWASLCHFAHRTYAPATEESRLSGAGAGTTDND